MTLVLAAVVAAGIVAPHLVALERVPPATAATIWFMALALRAVTVLFIALLVVLFLSTSELFGLVTHWCWHAVIPLMATHLGINGHEVGDAATIAPGFVLAGSVVSVAVGVWRAGRAIRGFLRRASLGRGPRDSVLVGGDSVLVAAAGIGRPRVVVSAGALASLDAEELAAGLDHERGHIARHHRFALLVAELFRSLARFLPGTRAAIEELRFHLERDADHWAIRRRNDPLALASAICKAGAQRLASGPAVASLSGAGTSRRVRQLIDVDSARSPRGHAAARVLACTMVVLTLAVLGVVPATAAAGLNQRASDQSAHFCPG